MNDKLAKETVRQAVLNNDVYRVVTMLEEFGLTENTLSYSDIGQQQLASAMLSFASVSALQENLSENLAEELIKRTAMIIDTLNLLELVVAIAGVKFKSDDYVNIPSEIRNALLKEEGDPLAVESIDNLDYDTFLLLASYIVREDEIKALNTKFKLPIILYLYQHEVVPIDLLFAYMAISLRAPFKERILMGIESAIGDFDRFLTSFFGDD